MSINSYNDGYAILSKDNKGEPFCKISPSQAASFFTNTTMWYRETLLGEKQVIENQDPLILGTIVHYFAEQASLKIKPTDPDKLVSDYLDSQTVTDRSDILSLWRDMSNTLIQGCIHGQRPPIATELFMFHKLLPGIYVAGTTDALIDLGNGSVSIRDYKTASTKPSGIPYNYRLQAHIYAFLATKAGYTVSQIELQYVTRPTKTLPCRHFEFIEPFTPDDLDKITNQLQLIAESVHFWNTHPQYRYLLAQDYRLKPPSKPTLFI